MPQIDRDLLHHLRDGRVALQVHALLIIGLIVLFGIDSRFGLLRRLTRWVVARFLSES